METYFVSCKKNTANENSIVTKTKQNRITFLSNCAICGKKNWILLKIKNSTALIIFEMVSLKWIKSLTNFYWLETDLSQNCLTVTITYNPCGSFTKRHERIQNLEKQVI